MDIIKIKELCQDETIEVTNHILVRCHRWKGIHKAM